MSRRDHDNQEDGAAPALLRLTVGLTVDHEGLYTITDDVGVAGREAQPLGVGASGRVYAAKFRGVHLRAIKFLALNDLIDESGEIVEHSITRFHEELITLTSLSHANIARVYDSGAYIDPQAFSWQYIVMDHISGQPLLETLQDSSVSSEQAYELIAQVLRAVSYMHTHHILHADLKSSNIICRDSPGGPEAVVVDLGLSHRAPARSFGAAGSKIPHSFITSWPLVHTLHREYFQRLVTPDVFKVLFPAHDLHSLGLLLKELTRRAKAKAKLSEVIGPDGLSALNQIIADLVDTPRSGKYTSSAQVAVHWQKLSRNYLAPAGVPELSLAAEFKYSMPTSAGRSVITPRLAEVINHKHLQRLQRIPQLELTQKKWASATHTRFGHSITVLRNSRYYIAHLLNDPSFRLIAEQCDLQATLLLGLLHDVGHYQLEHMFEDFASDQRVRRDSGTWRDCMFDIPGDDDLFWSVVDPKHRSTLRGSYGDVIQEADRRSAARLEVPEQSMSLADVIQQEFGDATYGAMLDIHNAIYAPASSQKISPSHLVLAAVLSSDIDADKVSYLREDSERTGTRYGEGVEFDALLGSLRMPALAQLTNRPVIGITRKGSAAAQSIAMNRNLMVGEVYWNHTNRSMTAMVKYVISRLLSKQAISMPEFIGRTFYAEYEATLQVLSHIFDENRDEGQANPIGGLIEGERTIYRTIFSTRDLDAGEAVALSERLTHFGFDEVIALENSLVETLRNVSGFSRLRHGELVVDTPLKERERPGGDRGGRVYVYEDRQDMQGVHLRELTPLMKATREQHVRENRVCRVFVAPRYASSTTHWDRAAAEIRSYMSQLG